MCGRSKCAFARARVRVRETQRETETETEIERERENARERERTRERARESEREKWIVCVCVCVCLRACVRECVQLRKRKRICTCLMSSSPIAKFFVSLSIPMPSVMVSYRFLNTRRSDCCGAYSTPDAILWYSAEPGQHSESIDSAHVSMYKPKNKSRSSGYQPIR